MSSIPTLKFTKVANGRWVAGDYEILKTKSRGCYANHGQWSVLCSSYGDAAQVCNDRAARLNKTAA